MALTFNLFNLRDYDYEFYDYDYGVNSVKRREPEAYSKLYYLGV